MTQGNGCHTPGEYVKNHCSKTKEICPMKCLEGIFPSNRKISFYNKHCSANEFY